MENRQTDDSADELEVVEMLGVDTGVGINLQGIIIVRGVFEETVERIEHFVREEEEEFTERLLVKTRYSQGEREAYRERPP